MRTIRRDWPAFVIPALLICLEAWLLVARPVVVPRRRSTVLRIAAAPSELVNARLSPYGKGFEHDLAEAFCRAHGLTAQWVYLDSWKQGWDMLAEGKIDVLAGPGLRPPVPDDKDSPFWGGPRYAATEILVLNNVDRNPLDDPSELCDAPLLLENIQTLPAMLADWLKPRGCHTTAAWTTELGQEKLLSMMDDEAARYAVVEARLYQLWQPFVPSVQPSEHTGRHVFRRWYWRKDSPQADKLREFWRDTGKAVAAELGVLYFGFLPPPSEFDYYEAWQLRQTIHDQLPAYRKAILAAAKKYDLDPLFLTAVIYQESNFDRHATSPTGVRGLMQLSQATAEYLGVSDRTDPRQSIMGGAKYLREIYNELDGEGFSPWNRWFVTLAAYNQGLGRTRDAMALAEDMDMSSKWRNIRRALRLLGRSHSRRAEAAYSGRTQAAYFVRNIRFYYYFLKGLSVLPGREADDLAPLAGALPPSWPGGS
ncbi:Lytic transglycosylase catalytic [Desulfovibrio sp. X2]|uniref:transglycosylase SLT domain-containing protein n=1 Tax=Desulfovibrio sp. X2 TaxID=941449 RepID=UPI000358ED50|nr:transglycosylase SLT domain-containing protein [Desulfovibrio sp. X2]EPR43534.1 Lytic transglycosylase catalytic [Desulfovibrio sp. X2]